MFPVTRLRRLRRHPNLRDLVRETTLSPQDLILPLFVRYGQEERIPIASMPGHFQLSVDQLATEVREIDSLGIPAVILFGIPEEKDAAGSDACSDAGIVQQAVRAIKEAAPALLVMTDVCLCEFTDHGHCGIIRGEGRGTRVEGQGPRAEGQGKENENPQPSTLNSQRSTLPDVDNDATLEILKREAVSHARAGADLVAPSGMMDGMVQAIRTGLDEAGFSHLPIMSYAAKYASGFYGPFRDAAESTPRFGDRATYQMDPANGNEALREVALDVAEGADILMVKPALSYLDIIRRVKEQHPEVPLAAYNVSGEYAMVKAAAAQGWIDEQRVALEILTSIRRAGADMILTYHARDVARWLG